MKITFEHYYDYLLMEFIGFICLFYFKYKIFITFF